MSTKGYGGVVSGKGLVVSKATGKRLGEHYILLKVIKQKTPSDHVCTVVLGDGRVDMKQKR